MPIDRRGFRAGVAIVLVDKRNRVFWAKRVGQNAWQFPQGGILKNESFKDAMFRELYEEVGLKPDDVEIVATSKAWLYYRLPSNMIRYGSQPLCIGQKQKWFLLRFVGEESRVQFNTTNVPEFDDYRWVYYWSPLKSIISFKKRIYRRVLKEFCSILFHQDSEITDYQ